MEDYEESYYQAKRKYNQAVEQMNNNSRMRTELNQSKKELLNERGQKEESLRKTKQNIILLKDAEDRCRQILDSEFQNMKNSINTVSMEYRRILNSDTGVADISEIYSSDITATYNDLNNILEELSNRRAAFEDTANTQQNELNNCNGRIDDVERQLNNLEDYNQLRRQAQRYENEMYEYKRKMNDDSGHCGGSRSW